MIVVTTFIKRRNFTFLSCEYPFQSFTGRMYTAYIVLVAGEVCARDQSISAFFCVFLQVFQSGILSNKLAELVVCIVVSFLAEFNRTFHYSHFIFVFHGFFVHYLQNDSCLSEIQAGQFIYRLADQGIDIFGVFSIQFGTFPACCADPVCFSCLSVLLSQFSKVSSSLQCSENTVGQSLGCIFSIGIYLNPTELDRVRSSSLGNDLECVVRIISLVVVRTINFVDCNRVQTGCYVLRQDSLVYRNVSIVDNGTGRTDESSEIIAGVSQLVAVVCYFFLYSLTVSIRRNHSYINVADVAGFSQLLELFFSGVIQLTDFIV